MNKFSEYLLFTTFVFFLHSPSKGLAEENILYVGTGGKAAQGIYQTSFNQKLGKFSDLSLAAEVDSPGFLTVHPLKNILYLGQMERGCWCGWLQNKRRWHS